MKFPRSEILPDRIESHVPQLSFREACGSGVFEGLSSNGVKAVMRMGLIVHDFKGLMGLR